MGKSAKAHRAKVEKRNRKIEQDKYSMNKAIERMFEARKMEMENQENVNVELNGQNLGFEVVEEIVTNEQKVEDQISELEK
jgi:hypothetical protein